MLKIFCRQVSGVSLDGSEEDRRIFFREKNAVGQLSVSLPPTNWITTDSRPSTRRPLGYTGCLGLFLLSRSSSPES